MAFLDSVAPPLFVNGSVTFPPHDEPTPCGTTDAGTIVLLDCLILGDSLAVGVGGARPGCTTVARVGITSTAFVQSLLPGAPHSAQSVVISLGVNDDASMPTLDTLRRLRAAISSPAVTWLLPAPKEEVRRAVRLVATEHGDRLVDTASQVGPDRLHPGRDGYRLIASWTEGGAGPPPSFTPISSAAPLRAVPLPMPGQAHPVLNAPRIITAGSGLRWQPMIPPGSAYGAFTPSAGPGANFAALPPPTFAYRAMLPLPVTGQR